jgi:hypothetical protein
MLTKEQKAEAERKLKNMNEEQANEESLRVTASRPLLMQRKAARSSSRPLPV